MLAKLIGSDVAAFKIGNELAESVDAPQAVKSLTAHGRVFRDCKLIDIPNTVAGAAAGLVQEGVTMFNVMCLGGKAMMAAGKEASVKKAKELGIEPPLALGVTILTSLEWEGLKEMGFDFHVWEPFPMTFTEERIAQAKREAVRGLVVKLAKLAREAGLDGVIASAQEAADIRQACGPDFLIVTPGIRLPGKDTHDQKRVMTPRDAIAAGADYLVVGRDITQAADPVAVVKQYNEAVAEALESLTYTGDDLPV